MQPEHPHRHGVVGQPDVAVFPQPGPRPGVPMMKVGISTRRLEVLPRGARRLGDGGIPAGEDGRDLLHGDRRVSRVGPHVVGQTVLRAATAIAMRDCDVRVRRITEPEPISSIADSVRWMLDSER